MNEQRNDHDRPEAEGVVNEHTAENDALVPGQKCPMSGQVISWDSEAWINEFGVCWKCGAETRLKVRATDRPPWARALTHKVPRPIPPGQGVS